MRLTDFDFELPEELIAERPTAKREEAKLFYFDPKKDQKDDVSFSQIVRYFNPGDVLVLNNTRVIPARLIAEKEATGLEIEIFYLETIEVLTTEHGLAKEKFSPDELEKYRFFTRAKVLLRPAKRVKDSDVLSIQTGGSEAKIIKAPGVSEEKIKEVFFLTKEPLLDFIDKTGEMPLPPYIKRDSDKKDREDYQTVFSDPQKKGAVAAPTAGLHFTKELLEQLQVFGVEILNVTLHVGIGTFQQVNVENISEHEMHHETCEIDKDVADKIQLAKQEKRRIIACGTTVVRTLESAVDNRGKLMSGSFSTNLFIYPPYEFKVIDGLITNFHLPKSTLLMMVSAFIGYTEMMSLYEEAIRKKYRFFSYGDAMFLVR